MKLTAILTVVYLMTCFTPNNYMQVRVERDDGVQACDWSVESFPDFSLVEIDISLIPIPGLSARDFVMHFKQRALVLFKLILLERKVLFFKSPVEALSSHILTLLSLFPGLLEGRGVQTQFKLSTGVEPSNFSCFYMLNRGQKFINPITLEWVPIQHPPVVSLSLMHVFCSEYEDVEGNGVNSR